MLAKTLISMAPAPRSRQKGVVLIVALVVLVAMTLAAIALVRSVDTNTIIAGNVAFQQAAIHSADTGIETAVAFLEANKTGNALDADDSTNGYAANGASTDMSPASGQSWDAFWQQSLDNRAYKFTSPDEAGNTVAFVIDRLCRNAGARTAGASCVASPSVTAATGNAEEAGEVQLNAPSVVYYRITVRVSGPKNTVSYVQSVVAL
ncbi:pilus assembly PilX family protein [Noviherbaspirillum massiliense]|uniref:pilus assembly PilX family protein n=1 Tax=Noviherbaspirillum massiliense TaxID=1465823 RepID=UPI001375D268|nr:hypothetical protein [Noviherbaspirillum massiliense]